jgi:hypothetical protein
MNSTERCERSPRKGDKKPGFDHPFFIVKDRQTPSLLPRAPRLQPTCGSGHDVSTPA